ncbi:hypothetical protein CHS0354_011883, partial [Potamilus streckersoni]
GCPAPYILYSTECGRFCYRYESSDCKVWSAARTVCRTEGGDLLEPSECYYNFFSGKAKQNEGKCRPSYWLGASTTTPGNNFVTVRDIPVLNSASFWNTGQPDGGNESCVEMASVIQYKANDNLCTNNQSFICQIFI